jgi:DHA1 family bicyclomycin/chloramphenicol resistance-like MFS transporter
MSHTASVAEVDPGAAPPETHGWRVLGVLSALMGFASISTDLYLPALPALPTMATSLKSDTGTMELTVAGYLIGFSLGQLLWGPLGDRHGRRGPVAVGLILFVVGSAGCALSLTATQMIAWRIVQAVGACAGVVLARAMVRDLYAGNRAASMLSTLMTVMAVAPLLGPLLGGQVLALAGWRAIFWLLAGVGLLTLAALATLPETLPEARRNREPLVRAFRRYGGLLREPRILGYAGAGGFFYGGMYAYIAGSPHAYITVYHVPPQLYGLLFGAGIVGIMVTNLVNARVVGRLGGDRLLARGAAGAALSGVALAVAAGTGWGGLAGLVVPCERAGRGAAWRRPAARPGRGRGGPVGRGSRRRGGNGLGRPGRSRGAVVRLHRGHRLHRRQLGRWRPERLPGARRRGVGPRRRDPLRKRHLRRRPGRCLRGRHPAADGLGHRPCRPRQRRMRPLRRASGWLRAVSPPRHGRASPVHS